MLKIFLDDVRPLPDDSWILIRETDIPMFIHLARHADVISMDHDLGESAWNGMTGYDVLKVLEKEVYEQGLYSGRGCPEFRIHSANPVGRQNMEARIASIHRKLEAL